MKNQKKFQTSSNKNFTKDGKIEIWITQFFENILKLLIKDIEENYTFLDEQSQIIEERCATLDKQEKDIEIEKKDLAQFKQQLEQDQHQLEQERHKLNDKLSQLSRQERQLKERELNAEAGFIAENQSALQALNEATTNLRQERDFLYQDIANRRKDFDSEIAQKQNELEQQLFLTQRRYDEELKIKQSEIDTEYQELLLLKKEVKKEQRKLEIERELLEEDKEHIEAKISLQFNSRIESLQFKIEELQATNLKIKKVRDELEDKLNKRIEADRRFGQKTPEQILEILQKLRDRNEQLKQKLAEQPSGATLERLQQLETLQETWESERLQLKTRVQEQERALSLSRVEVTNLEILRNEKEAMEAGKARLSKALEDLRADLERSIADDQKRSQFEHCAEMDQNQRLQTPSQLYNEIPDLRLFANDLRNRIALSQGKRLYYSEHDIRAFIGGLAMSRLHILQGISGTGKTSLPLAFAHAIGTSINTNYKLIEIQAGWRDRQDLIGYFNAFEGRFYETDFFKAIYEAQTPFYRDQIYIVLLDEMNLSRPEQYFADFLSKLEQAELGRTPTLSLQSDPNKPFPNQFKNNELPIPPNIWFIGTANQDETTLEFADKTYDRAHIMELYGQADPFEAGNPEARHPIAYSALISAFEKAKKAHINKAKESWQFLNQSELRNLFKLFKLGWGNRLKRQIIAFVPVVVAAGGTVGEATDHIMATKILRKLRDRHDTPIDDLKRLYEYIEVNWELLDSSFTPVQSLSILEAEIHRLSGGGYTL